MKEKIVGVLSWPYLDKYVVEVFRQTDRFHVPTKRLYIAYYSNPDRVFNLINHFLNINEKLQFILVAEKIQRWNGNKN